MTKKLNELSIVVIHKKSDVSLRTEEHSEDCSVGVWVSVWLL